MAYLHEELFTIHLLDEHGDYHTVEIMAADIKEKDNTMTFYDRWGNVTGSFKKLYMMGFSRKEKK